MSFTFKIVPLGSIPTEANDSAMPGRQHGSHSFGQCLETPAIRTGSPQRVLKRRPFNFISVWEKGKSRMTSREDAEEQLFLFEFKLVHCRDAGFSSHRATTMATCDECFLSDASIRRNKNRIDSLVFRKKFAMDFAFDDEINQHALRCTLNLFCRSRSW